jgi:hypothetical protein
MKTTHRNNIFRLFATLGLCALVAGGCALPQKITLSFSEKRQLMSEDREGLVVTKKAIATEPQAPPEKDIREVSAPPPPTESRMPQSPAIGFQAGNGQYFSLLERNEKNDRIAFRAPADRLTFLNESLLVGKQAKSPRASPSEKQAKRQHLIAYDAFFEAVEEEHENPQGLNLAIEPEPVAEKSDLVLRSGDFVFRAKVKDFKITFTWPVLALPQVKTHFRIEPKEIMWWLNLEW